jgi:hypothetical protein
VRRIVLLGLLALAAGCGAGARPAPAPGTPQNPLVASTSTPAAGAPAAATRGAPARSAEPAAPAAPGQAVRPAAGAKTPAAPGYQALVERQASRPRSRFTPCNLVSAAEARALVGAPVLQPFEAPQGPTCIYRSQDGKRFVTVAVQATSFGKLKGQIRRRRPVSVSDHAAYCGTYGQPMLYVPLARGRVLSVGAPCDLAKGFALKALAHL